MGITLADCLTKTIQASRLVRPGGRHTTWHDYVTFFKSLPVSYNLEMFFNLILINSKWICNSFCRSWLILTDDKYFLSGIKVHSEIFVPRQTISNLYNFHPYLSRSLLQILYRFSQCFHHNFIFLLRFKYVHRHHNSVICEIFSRWYLPMWRID